MSDLVRRVPVWPGLQRVLHWTLALTAVLGWLSGWLLETVWVLSDRLRDFLVECSSH